jgi:hypothetical protein
MYDLNVSGSGTLIAGTGTIYIAGGWNAGITTTSPLSVYNLNIGDGESGGELFIFSGTITVGGDLTLDFTVSGTNNWVAASGGTLQVVGNITQDSGWTIDNGSSTNIIWIGTGSKSFTQPTGSYFPMNFTINGSGTLNMGTYAAFLYNFTYTAGSVTAATTTYFICQSSANVTITPGSMSFNNVSFGDGTAGSDSDVLCALSGTMNVGGNLIFDDYYYSYNDAITGGATINLSGNLQDTKWSDVNSSLTINMVGTGAQTITQAASASIPQGTLEISGASSSVSLASAVKTNYTNWSVTAGTLYMAGHNLTIEGLALSSTTVHKKDSTGTSAAGTLKVNGSTISNGSNFGGTIAN